MRMCRVINPLILQIIIAVGKCFVQTIGISTHTCVHDNHSRRFALLRACGNSIRKRVFAQKITVRRVHDIPIVGDEVLVSHAACNQSRQPVADLKIIFAVAVALRQVLALPPAGTSTGTRCRTKPDSNGLLATRSTGEF